MGKSADPFEVLFKKNRYDLKSFAKNHPGGVDTLEKFKNKSVADGMLKYDHSQAAYHIMQDYKVVKDDTPVIGNGLKANGHVVNGKLKSNSKSNERNGNISNGPSIKTVEHIEESDREANIKEREKENEELMKLEALMDWSQPMLSQLHRLGPDYERWVNAPVDRHLRLFANPLLESLTFSPWWVVPTFWLPIITYLLYWQYTTFVLCTDNCPGDGAGLSNVIFAANILLGMLAWTLLEYSIHRWVFHLDPGSSNNLRTFHFLLHGLHHKVPFDSLRLVFPPIPAAVITLGLYYPLSAVLQYPVIFTTGGLIGYLTYDMIHAYIHNGSPEDGTYLYEMKRYHANHHFVNSDKGFGISNKLWDNVFQTKIKLKKLGFSLRW